MANDWVDILFFSVVGLVALAIIFGIADFTTSRRKGGYMETESILWVSEAFSMQPIQWRVGQRYEGRILVEIIEDEIVTFTDRLSFYIGYDADKKKIFQIRKECATVFFK
jgi:hypothetical protein